MCKVPCYFLSAGAFLAISLLTASADVVTLNSGEQIKGKVVSETATKVIFDAEVRAGIIDTRTYDKKDVKSVSKTLQDEIVFQSIKNYRLGPNSYTMAEYEALERSFGSFVAKFPGSAHFKEVKEVLDAVQKEKARVEKGELKWNNRWYSAIEAKQESYEISAQKALAVMRDYARRGDTVAALNTFDYIERTYPNATIYPDAIVDAVGLIHRLQAEVARAVVVAKQQQEQFNTSIQLVTEPQKSHTIAARKAQIEAAEQAVQSAEINQVKWKPFLPITDKSMSALVQIATQELQRVPQLPLSAMRSSIEKTESAAKALAEGDYVTADLAAKEAQSLWSTYEVLTRLMPAISALKEHKTATPTPAPVVPVAPPKPGTPKTTGTKPA